MQFNNNELLWLLITIPVFFWLLYLKKDRRGQIPINWFGIRIIKSPMWGLLLNIARFSTVLPLFLLILALAQPVLVHQRTVSLGKSLSIIFAIDSSISMGTRDIEGQSRVEAIASAVEEFTKDSLDIEIGVTGFADQSALLCPPSSDKKSILLALRKIKPGVLGLGTSLGMGVTHASSYINETNQDEKSIVLFSDGENNDTDLALAATTKMLLKLKIRLYTIGIGKNGHSTIEYFDNSKQSFVRGTYDSKIDIHTLQEAARTSNGEFFQAQKVSDIVHALNTIRDRENVQNRSRTLFEYEDISNLFIYISLFSFILNFGIRKILLKEIQ